MKALGRVVNRNLNVLPTVNWARGRHAAGKRISITPESRRANAQQRTHLLCQLPAWRGKQVRAHRVFVGDLCYVNSLAIAERIEPMVPPTLLRMPCRLL